MSVNKSAGNPLDFWAAVPSIATVNQRMLAQALNQTRGWLSAHRLCSCLWLNILTLEDYEENPDCRPVVAGPCGCAKRNCSGSTTFSYPTGNITNNTPLWLTHSGTAKDALVVSYPGSAASVAGTRLEVNQGRADDIHRWFYPADTGAVSVVYVSFVVSATNLPANAGGSYFAHLMDKSTMFRGRLFATVPANPYPFTSTVPGVYRFGVANNQGDYSSAAPTTTGPSMTLPVDLALNTDYLLVIALRRAQRDGHPLGQSRFRSRPLGEHLRFRTGHQFARGVRFSPGRRRRGDGYPQYSRRSFLFRCGDQHPRPRR